MILADEPNVEHDPPASPATCQRDSMTTPLATCPVCAAAMKLLCRATLSSTMKSNARRHADCLFSPAAATRLRAQRSRVRLPSLRQSYAVSFNMLPSDAIIRHAQRDIFEELFLYKDITSAYDALHPPRYEGYLPRLLRHALLTMPRCLLYERYFRQRLYTAAMACC